MIINDGPQLTEDREKIQEAILYVMTFADGLSQYDIAKTLFLADRMHLNRHGRPVTFDNYVAMENGPVPSVAYDALKPDEKFRRHLGDERPWMSSPDPCNPKINRFTPKREPDLSFLSGSDLAALRWAWNTIKDLSFDQVRRLTHEDIAYIEAWDRRGEKKSAPMKLPLLIDRDAEAREALADDLIYISAHA